MHLNFSEYTTLVSDNVDDEPEVDALQLNPLPLPYGMVPVVPTRETQNHVFHHCHEKVSASELELAAVIDKDAAPDTAVRLVGCEGIVIVEPTGRSHRTGATHRLWQSASVA
jgi:hypothetical protein